MKSKIDLKVDVNDLREKLKMQSELYDYEFSYFSNKQITSINDLEFVSFLRNVQLKFAMSVDSKKNKQ